MGAVGLQIGWLIGGQHTHDSAELFLWERACSGKMMWPCGAKQRRVGWEWADWTPELLTATPHHKVSKLPHTSAPSATKTMNSLQSEVEASDSGAIIT